MSRGRKPKYPAATTFRQLILLDRCGPRNITAADEAELDRALNGRFEASPTWNHQIVRNVHLADLDLPSRARSALQEMRIETVGELMIVRRTQLLAQERLGRVTLTKICQEVADLLWPPVIGGEAQPLDAYGDLVACYVRSVVDDQRKAELALGRLAPQANRPLPLREVGQRHNLSRERVRQIVDQIYDRLGKPAKLLLLRPFWEEVWAILQSWDKPVELERLSDGLRRRLGWEDVPPCGGLARLFVLHPELGLADTQVVLKPMADQ